MSINRIRADIPDPRYMLGDREIPEYRDSTNDEGGTLNYYRGSTIGVPLPHGHGSTFINPGVLPPVRSYQIEGGGRLVNPEYLPPVREYQIEMEPGADMPFHVGGVNRKEE